MEFRVTNSHVTGVFIDQVNRNKVELETTRNQLTTGLKVSNPSDDPGRAGTIATLQSTMQRLTRHQERIGFANSFLAAQEGALGSAQNVLIRMRELATQAANESLSHEQRDQLAAEVYQLRDSLAALANTQYEGRYVFGGLVENDKPVDFDEDYFDVPAAPEQAASHYVFDTTAGRDLSRDVAISDSESIRINTPAIDVFKNAMDAATQLGRALRGYETFRDGAGNLQQNGNNAQLNLPTDFEVQTGQILEAMDLIEQARSDEIQIEISDLGARMNRLDQTNEILTTLITSADNARGGIQDVDVVEAASRFTELQISLEALLNSGARINNLSLLDFL